VSTGKLEFDVNPFGGFTKETISVNVVVPFTWIGLFEAGVPLIVCVEIVFEIKLFAFAVAVIVTSPLKVDASETFNFPVILVSC
jgi:hypothetical protein